MSAVIEMGVRDDHSVDRPVRIDPVQARDVRQGSDPKQARDVERWAKGFFKVRVLKREVLAEVDEDGTAIASQEYLGAADLADTAVEGEFNHGRYSSRLTAERRRKVLLGA